MARQAPRRNQDGVESELQFGMLGMRDQPALSGVDDALLLARRDREGGVIGIVNWTGDAAPRGSAR